MPLTRDTMTTASRVTLPTYVIFFGWLGITYLLAPRDRLDESPALRYTDTVIDLRALGILLLGAGALMAYALVRHSRDTSRYALVVAGICHGIIFCAFLLATFYGDASPSAAAWPMLGLAACVASYRSVTSQEA